MTQPWAAGAQRGSVWIERADLTSIPLLMAVVFLIAASQVDLIAGSTSVGLLIRLTLVFAGFLVIVGPVARVVANAFGLPPKQGRVLAFSFGTRNSFVVLPLALALPDGLELAAAVVVLQSPVELLGMLVYLWWVPRKLFPVANEA